MNKNKNETRPDLDLLQSVLHNSEICITSINYILPETKSNAFEDELRNQKRRFIEITQKAKKLAEQEKLCLKPNSLLKKAKMWMSIKTSSFFDDETSHLAEIMMLGNFMGVVNMIKSLADAKNAKPEILEIARELKSQEEDAINKFVPFLEKTKI